MSSPPKKPWKRSKLAVQSPISGNLQPPVVLPGASRDADSPSSKHKDSLSEIKQNSKELKISTPTVKPKFDLKKKPKEKEVVDSSLITQAKKPKQKPTNLNIETTGSSSKAIGASFFSTLTPEIKEVFSFIRYLPLLSPPERNKLLLPKQARSSPKLTVVLDLDETLVHCNTLPIQSPDVSFPVTFNGCDFTISGRLRPHCQTFLQKCASRFELVLFTASQKIYAEKLANLIDPSHSWFKFKLYRDSCTLVGGNYLKDLESLGRDLKRTVIVDNAPQAFGYHINNGIPITSWYDDENDTELLNVYDFLLELEKEEDIRPLIEKSFGLHQRIFGEETSSPSSPTVVVEVSGDR